MKILHVRSIFTKKSSVGRYYINGVEQCLVIEDKDRGLNNGMTLEEINKIKVFGETCIPYTVEGKPYEIIISRSVRFSKLASAKAGKPVDVLLPEIIGVPGWAGARIHPGNKPEDSEGCPLPGFQYQPVSNPDFLGDSKAAFAAINAKIEQAIARKEKVYLEIIKHESPQVI